MDVYRDGIKIDTVTSTSFRDTTTEPEKNYSYSITAFDAKNNESAHSTIMNYSTPGNIEAPKILQGSFIQPQLIVSWTASNWETEFSYMKNVYMDHLIWQWTIDSYQNLSYYPSSLGFTNASQSDQVRLSLEATKNTNLKIWLGLNWTDTWWNNYANNETWLINEFNLSKNIAQELWDLYGNDYADTIAGFYMTMEVDNVNFMATENQNRPRDSVAVVYSTL